MSTRNALIGCTLGAFAMIALTGCFFPTAVGDEFQGGSSTAQATSKFIADRWDQMNPDDIQMLPIIAESLGLAEAGEIPEVTDEQAAAVVDFIAANDIVTSDDLQEVITRASEDPGSVVIPESVQDVLDSLGVS